MLSLPGNPPADLQMPRPCCRQPSLNTSAKLPLPQFNFRKDIARNPELARAARAALSSSPGNHSVLTGGGGTARQPLQFGAELDSLTAVVDALDRDAAEESRINQQMAAAVLGRLQSGRAAAERTLAVLQVRRLLLGSWLQLVSTQLGGWHIVAERAGTAHACSRRAV